MQFNSIEFFIFLPLVFLLYWSLYKSMKLQNALIVAVSYVFYGWWNVRLLFLIALTSFLSYLSGVLIERMNTKGRTNHLFTPKNVMLLNVIVNLGILGVFKYYNFFIDNLIDLFSIFGIHLQLTTLQLILPVGISFYTFQALSYTIDVYHHRIRPTNDVLAFFAYVSFFPQLVAGPIERATNLLPQFLAERKFDYDKAVDGMRQILWGFFMKVVIADNCAGIVNIVFNRYEEASWPMLALGALMFTFQIYGDFAGYSNIAIGSARLFGFNLMENFRNPYFSANIPEFWRRWHVSLNTWFRDYVYIPLGGNKHGKMKQIRNIMVVFGLSGLWHGANWTYVVWGIYHGVFVAFFRKDGWFSRRNFFTIATTFVVVVFGWIIFRADSISQAADYIPGLLTLQQGEGRIGLALSDIKVFSTSAFIVVLMLLEYLTKDRPHPLVDMPSNRLLRWGTYLFLIFLMLVFIGKSETFIYFQF